MRPASKDASALRRVSISLLSPAWRSLKEAFASPMASEASAPRARRVRAAVLTALRTGLQPLRTALKVAMSGRRSARSGAVATAMRSLKAPVRARLLTTCRACPRLKTSAADVRMPSRQTSVATYHWVKVTLRTKSDSATVQVASKSKMTSRLPTKPKLPILKSQRMNPAR